MPVKCRGGISRHEMMHITIRKHCQSHFNTWFKYRLDIEAKESGAILSLRKAQKGWLLI